MVLVSPKELILPADLIDAMRSAGVVVETSEDLAPSIADVDIVYSTRIKKNVLVMWKLIFIEVGLD